MAAGTDIRPSRRAVIGGAAALVVTRPAFAQQTGFLSDLSHPQGQRLLRVAMPRFGSPPFFEKAGDSDAGIDVDMARAVAHALDLELVFDRSATTFDEAVEQIARGDADLAVCKLSRTVRRGRLILYSRPYAVLNHGLITNRVRFARLAAGHLADDVVRDFRGDLGVIAHSSFAEFAATSFPNARVREYADWSAMVDAVRREEIDMAYRDDFEIKKLMVDDPSLTVVARSITLTDRTDTLAIGVRPDMAHLASFADLFLDLTRGDEMMKTDTIIARYRAARGA